MNRVEELLDNLNEILESSDKLDELQKKLLYPMAHVGSMLDIMNGEISAKDPENSTDGLVKSLKEIQKAVNSQQGLPAEQAEQLALLMQEINAILLDPPRYQPPADQQLGHNQDNSKGVK